MEILMNVWLALNVVFGLWSARNWIIYLYAVFTNATFKQSDVGKALDLLIVSSIMAYWITVH